MYAGQLVELSSTREIYTDPKHPYTQALIEAMPRLRTRDKEIRFIKGNPPSLLQPPSGCRFYERCVYAKDICKNIPPEVGRGKGYVRCWMVNNSVDGPQT
jgi:peptide/nickel transport system ATP-binding protein